MTRRTAIAICTYRRPDGLARALASLIPLITDDCTGDVVVVVVDNAPEEPVAQIVASLSRTYRFPLKYVSVPQKGLANARNAALQAARVEHCQRLAFLDDDEMASDTWLQSLSETMDRKSVNAVAGPTYPLFQKPPGAWTAIDAYAYVPLRNDDFALDASSANLLIDLETVALEFDPIFNESGGEDTHFIACLLKAGQRIGWAPTAIVWDSIPAERMRTGWLLRRWFRTGVTEARIGALQYNASVARLRNAYRGFVRIGYGACRVVYGAIRAFPSAPSLLVASCYTLCRGAGYVAGAVGRSFSEYSASRYR